MRSGSMLPLAVAVGVLFTAQPSYAVSTTIIKLNLGEVPGDDLQFVSGELSTIDATGAGITGDQATDVIFVGPLDFLADDLNDTHSFTLDNVIASGDAQLNGNVVVQPTQGGDFALYDASNTLLLSGALNSGAILGSLTSTSGSFFNTSFASFTGGTLLQYISSTEDVGLSFALTNIHDGGPGLSVFDCESNSCSLRDFSADANGLIEGSPIPEPFTGLLLLSGVAGAAVRRRKLVA